MLYFSFLSFFFHSAAFPICLLSNLWLPFFLFISSLLQIVAYQPYNKAVDWWSYGVLLYEMLAGQVTLIPTKHVGMWTETWSSLLTTSEDFQMNLNFNILFPCRFSWLLSLSSSHHLMVLMRRSCFSPSWSRVSPTQKVSPEKLSLSARGWVTVTALHAHIYLLAYRLLSLICTEFKLEFHMEMKWH